MVKLEENHTLKSHFDFLGRNLSETHEAEFRWMEAFHGYRITASTELIYNYIRFDSGVEFVTHNSITEYESDSKNETSRFDDDDDSHLPKRKHPWKTTWNNYGYWPMRMLNYWEKDDHIADYDFLDVVSSPFPDYIIFPAQSVQIGNLGESGRGS